MYLSFLLAISLHGLLTSFILPNLVCVYSLLERAAAGWRSVSEPRAGCAGPVLLRPYRGVLQHHLSGDVRLAAATGYC